LGKQTHDDQLITNYILGRLSEEEVERLDALSLAEDEFAYRLQAVEDDLVDAYVNRELTGQNLESFNSHYLLTPRRLDRVKFATAFQLIMNRSVAADGIDSVQEPATVRPERVKRASSRRSLRALYAVLDPPIRWGLGAAAMVMLLLGAGLVVDNFRLRSRLGQENTGRPALSPSEQDLRAQLEQERSANSEIEKELERTRGQLNRFEQRQAESQKPALLRDLAIAHFDLSPQTRAIDRVTTISIPPGTDYVSFQLELEPGEVHSYRAELKTQSGNQVIWRSGKLNARSSGKGRVTNISIPARMLFPRWYILELSAISGSSTAEVEAGYPFRIEKR
jgi:hypothetical protein